MLFSISFCLLLNVAFSLLLFPIFAQSQPLPAVESQLQNGNSIALPQQEGVSGAGAVSDNAISGVEEQLQSANPRDVFRNDTYMVSCSEPICFGDLAPIYCHGPMIWASWYFGMNGLCPGEKLKRKPNEVIAAFSKLYDENGNIHRAKFERFCLENFESRAYLEHTDLPDWTPEPDILADLEDPALRRLAQKLHELWRDLARRFTSDVKEHQELYPVLSVPSPFIVPSSSLQVYYFWDTFWIIRGLLISGLFDTARGILENFVHVRKAREHFPNNGYIWSSRRAQPPLFAHMIFVYFEATGDREFLMRMLPEVEEEMRWLQSHRAIQVRSPRDNSTQLTVFLYRDYYLAMQSERDPQFFWSSTHSAIESGSDFSTRWYTMPEQSAGDEDMIYTRKGIKTGKIVPVCLNVMIARNYQILSQLYGDKLANKEKALRYQQLADTLIQAIDDLFLDRSDSMGVWYDFDLEVRALRKKFYPANILPLLLLNEDSDPNKKMRDCSAAVQHLQKSGALGFKGGIPSSMERRAFDLWDFPNAWPPHQEQITGCLLRCNELPEAFLIAKQAADKFLRTTYKGLFNPRPGMPAQMWEKYDVRFDDGRSRLGDKAAQGQTGFGWSNGLALIYMKIFYTNRTGVAQSLEVNVTALREFFMFDNPEVARPGKKKIDLSTLGSGGSRGSAMRSATDNSEFSDVFSKPIDCDEDTQKTQQKCNEKGNGDGSSSSLPKNSIPLTETEQKTLHLPPAAPQSNTGISEAAKTCPLDTPSSKNSTVSLENFPNFTNTTTSLSKIRISNDSNSNASKTTNSVDSKNPENGNSTRVQSTPNISPSASPKQTPSSDKATPSSVVSSSLEQQHLGGTVSKASNGLYTPFSVPDTNGFGALEVPELTDHPTVHHV